MAKPVMAQRIRSRRKARRLRGFELADKAGISPSYISLIEKGSKVPDEEVAARLAFALADDEALYRAWAREARLGRTDWDAVERLRRISADPTLQRQLARGDDIWDLMAPDTASPTLEPGPEDPAIPPRPIESPEQDVDLVEVPVLYEGADPGESSSSLPRSSVQDHLHLDQKLFASGTERDLFAYVVGREGGSRIQTLVTPGDYVVFRRRARRISTDRIHAVRFRGRVVLSRVLFKGRSLLLLPQEGQTDFDVVEVGDENDARRAIAGYSVLLIQR